MVEIEVLLSLNGSDEERIGLDISQEALKDLLGTGFAENIYEGSVTYKYLPRAFDPNFMEIIVDLKDIAETLIAWGTIAKVLVDFIKKTKSYEHVIYVRRKTKDEEIEIDIPVDKDIDSAKLLKEIRKILD